MDEIGEYNLFVGGLSGVFKGLRVTYVKGIHNVKNLQNIKEINKRNELTVLNWGNSDETEILLGNANQQVRIYDLQSKTFVFDKILQYGEGGICGISKYNGQLLTGVESGSICIWGNDDLTSPTSVINTKGPLERVRHSCVDRDIVAAGGKENDLSLWNLETQQSVFLAKNVRHDELELRVPIWVSDMCFIPDTQKVAVSTRHGHVRLYDPSTQTRRPVVQVEVKDQPLMCIAVAPRDHHVVVGSGKGNMYLVDLRGKGVLLNHYKGFVGGVRQIVCTPSEPYIASVGLDRHVRIHNLNTKQLLHKEYLQSQLSCILAKSSFTMSPDQVDMKEESEFKQEAESVVDVSDEEYETMFDNMEIIVDGEKKKTKKEINSNINKVEDDLTKEEKHSETEIVKEDAAETEKKVKNFRKTNVFKIEDYARKSKSDAQLENVEKIITENRGCVDTEIIETGDTESRVETDEEVETVKIITIEKTPTVVDTHVTESKTYDIIEIDDEDEHDSDVEVETINKITVQRKSDVDDIEDEDSDIVEIYHEEKGRRYIEVEGTEEVVGRTSKFTSWNQMMLSSYDTDDEDEDSDIIEIEKDEVVDNFNSCSTGTGIVRMEGEREVAEKEDAQPVRGCEPKYKSDIANEKNIDVTEVEDNLKSSSEEETVKNVVSDKKNETSRKGRNEHNQGDINVGSQRNTVLEEKEGIDKIESESKPENNITDQVSDGSNIEISEDDIKNNENIELDRTKNKKKKSKNTDGSHKIENDSEAEKNITDQVSDGSNIRISADDIKNNENVVVDKTKNKKRKRSKNTNGSHKIESDSDAEKNITDQVCDDSNIRLSEDDKNGENIVADKDKNKKRKKNKNMDGSHKIENDSDAETNITDQVCDDSNIRLSEDDKNGENIVANKDKNKRRKKNKNMDGSHKIENDSDAEKNITDQVSDDSNIRIDEDDKNSESIVTDKDKNKKRKKNKNVDSSHKIENDSEAEKNITDQVSDDSNIRIDEDDKNSESIAADKNKNKRRKKNKNVDSSHKIENDSEAEKNITDQVCDDSDIRINEDNKNCESIVADKNKNKRRKKSKNMDDSQKIENDLEAEKKVTDKVFDDSNIGICEDDKNDEGIVADKNKNRRRTKSKNVDGSYKIENDPEAVKKVTDQVCENRNVGISEDNIKSNESIVAGKNKNKRGKKSKSIDGAHKIENDSETEKKITDQVCIDSSIRISEDDKNKESIVADKNKNKRGKKSNDIDSSKVINISEKHNRRSLRSGNKKGEADSPKANPSKAINIDNQHNRRSLRSGNKKDEADSPKVKRRKKT